MKEKERKGKERKKMKRKERKIKDKKVKERKGKERKGKTYSIHCKSILCQLGPFFEGLAYKIFTPKHLHPALSAKKIECKEERNCLPRAWRRR